MRSEPEWVEPFLRNLRETIPRRGFANISLAADLTGHPRSAIYWYRNSRRGESFRRRWDLIVLQHGFRKQSN